MARLKIVSLMMVTAVPLVAYAGSRSTQPVSIALDESGAAYAAQGALSDAYNSADANQMIGCGGRSALGWCQAHDATADAEGLVNSAFCTTSDPTFIAHIRSITADTFVRFTIDPETGDCLTLSVSHNSFYSPKSP